MGTMVVERSSTTATAMKALVRDSYGTPARILQLDDVAKPAPADDGVLVRVRAASLNRIDWYEISGTPYFIRALMGLRRPKERALGSDFAGAVEAVGKDVRGLNPGDEVFGARGGALAEYVSVCTGVAKKPANLTFEEAAAVPVAALTALQGLRDKGQVKSGQKVLINGASGGAGTFAVQIAKALAAEVTAVCSTRNVEQSRAVGADRVIDYTREDFTRTGERYDVLFDNAGSRPWSHCKRVLTPDATVVVAGGPKTNRLLGPLPHFANMRLASVGSGRTAVFFRAKLDKEDLDALRELIEAGEVTPVVERRYELADIADAVAYMGEGHPQGKIVISL
jgi:NADPH:quinone reductase-like Zn-dependent oxidoreductase